MMYRTVIPVRYVLAALFVVVYLAGLALAEENPREQRKTYPTAEAFSCTVLTEGLDFPWEMLWGPDNKLWITERHGLKITKVDPETGDKKTIATLPEAYPGPQHEGILGMAFDKDFLKGGDNYLYVYYTSKAPDTEKRWATLARYTYDPDQEALGNKVKLLEGLPAGDDHNAGRVRLGPDDKLYVTIGEQGHNQGKNFCLPIEAQRIPTWEEVQGRNYDSYRGKSLRINLDGSVPSDNPEIRGVRSHVFTYGHRNPQGLAFVNNDLYSCEQGPSSDDEINLLLPGGNYGWPHVAGFRDDQTYVYANYSAAQNCQSLAFDPNIIPEGVPIQHELEWFDPNFIPPVKTFYTVHDGYNYSDSRCGADHAYLCWPTIAPSSIIYYPTNGAIPSWRGSLLVTTLKTGALFRLKLSGDQKQLQGDYDKVFRSQNRYRTACLDPEGRRIFIATDNSGGAKTDDGGPAESVRDSGAILVFTYDPDNAYSYTGQN